jgi:hypothetical protein
MRRMEASRSPSQCRAAQEKLIWHAAQMINPHTSPQGERSKKVA